MTVVTLRPTSTIAANSSVLTGAATRHEALSDNSDASYVVGGLVGGNFAEYVMGFTAPTIPSGARVSRAALRARDCLDLAGSSGAPVSYRLDLGVATDLRQTTVTWSSPTTYTAVQIAPGGSALPTVYQVGILDGYVRTNELYLDVTYVAKPTVAVATPTGTITTTNRPLVSWTPTLDGVGGAQSAFTARIFTAAQYGAGGFDPATSACVQDFEASSAAGSWTPPAVLPNGTYRAYVRVAQLVNGQLFWSDYAFIQFVINVDLPAAPAVVVTVQGARGRNKIQVTHQTGAATTTGYELQRSLDGGTTWTPLRLGGPPGGGVDGVIDGAAGLDYTTYDFEAPNGAPVSYRVRSRHDYIGAWASSAWVTPAAVTWTTADWWLKSPTRPGLNTVVTVKAMPGYQRPARQGKFQPLGASRAIVVSDTRGAEEGTLTLLVSSSADKAAIDALLALGTPLLLQGVAGQDWRDRYVSIGDLSRDRLISSGLAAANQKTIDSLPWTEVDAPLGLVVDWPGDA